VARGSGSDGARGDRLAKDFRRVYRGPSRVTKRTICIALRLNYA